MQVQTPDDFYKACLAGISERDTYMRVKAATYTPESFAQAFDALGSVKEARVMNVTDPVGDYFFVRTAGEPSAAQFKFAQAQGYIPSIKGLRDNLDAALPFSVLDGPEFR